MTNIPPDQNPNNSSGNQTGSAGMGHNNPPPDRKKPGPPKSAKTKMAEDLGISRHRMHQGIALTHIPKPLFNALLDQDSGPPTMEKMAALGRAIERGDDISDVYRTLDVTRFRRTRKCPCCGYDLSKA